jgi:hypothetical protein
MLCRAARLPLSTKFWPVALPLGDGGQRSSVSPFREPRGADVREVEATRICAANSPSSRAASAWSDAASNLFSWSLSVRVQRCERDDLGGPRGPLP